MKDRFSRNIDYMRISITDRCNLRCRYCMPPEGIEKVPMESILKYEEIIRICEAAVQLGITKFKVTGGEPLVRKGCGSLCASVKEIPGVEQVTLTTNGQLLRENIKELAEAVDGINISLDSLREDRFRLITGGGDLERTLDGIDASIESGIKTKINCLMQKGFNEDELIDFASMAFERGIDVRFIEMMPVGFGRSDKGLSNSVLLERLQSVWPELAVDEEIHGNGPAVYYKIPGKKGTIGLISPMHGRFCQKCNRLRLTSQGFIKPCLCYEDSYDIKPALRSGKMDELKSAIRESIDQKPDGHSFHIRESVEKRPMAVIGG